MSYKIEGLACPTCGKSSLRLFLGGTVVIDCSWCGFRDYPVEDARE